MRVLGSYYSFHGDVVLDPFAGIGTVGRATARLGRRFVLIDQEASFVAVMREEVKQWLGPCAGDVLTINCPPIDVSDLLHGAGGNW